MKDNGDSEEDAGGIHPTRDVEAVTDGAPCFPWGLERRILVVTQRLLAP